MGQDDKKAAAGNKAAAILASGIVATLLLAVPAPAADDTIDTVVYWGADLNLTKSSEFGVGANLGLVTALNGDIGISGWMFSGNVGLYHSESPGSRSDSFYDSLLIGYQWSQPEFEFLLFGGGNFVSNDESPSGGPIDGAEPGAIVQYVFQTKQTNAFFAQSYGSVSTINDQLYLHAKAGYKTVDLSYGAEFTLYDETASRGSHRYGAFVGGIAVTESVSMGISAGYQEDRDPGDRDGAYATVSFSTPLSLR